MTQRFQQTVAATVGVVALLSLFFVIRLPSDKAWLRVGLDASHGPIFAAVAIILAAWLHARAVARNGQVPWPDWASAGRALAVAAGIGVAVEFLEGLQNRPPSLFDLGSDIAGAAVGLALWTLLTRPRSETRVAGHRRAIWTLAAIALLGVTYVGWRPLEAAIAYAGRAAAFPVIAQFRGERDLYFVSTDGTGSAVTALPEPWARQGGESALRLSYDAAHAPAVQVVEPSPDWRGHDVIAVDLTNAGDTELTLVFRVLDAAHDWSHEDRLNLPLVIAPRTRTTVRVALEAVESAPAARRMDMARIANVMLFGRGVAGSGDLYVSRIWLE